MEFNIAGSTHIGTERSSNQDRILMQDNVFESGIYYYQRCENCFCFVADGIGGGPKGEFAAQFILKKISSIIDKTNNYSENDLLQIFRLINLELIDYGISNLEYRGTGSTLAGILITKDAYHFLNAGDSEIYVYRNNSIIKLTEDQVIDQFEDNSPITSYFGGYGDQLEIEFGTILREILISDVFLLCSDGLFKSLDIKQMKAILSTSKPLRDKVEFTIKKALELGAGDNISCILIETVNNT